MLNYLINTPNIEHLTHDLYWDEYLTLLLLVWTRNMEIASFIESLRIVLTRGFGVKIVWCVCVCVAQCQPQKGAAWWEMSLKLQLFLQKKTVEPHCCPREIVELVAFKSHKIRFDYPLVN